MYHTIMCNTLTNSLLHSPACENNTAAIGAQVRKTHTQCTNTFFKIKAQSDCAQAWATIFLPTVPGPSKCAML